MPPSPDPTAETSGNRRMSPACVAGVAGVGDRISALPDDVLLRVMSHMDARHAVQTCMLSRRWRDLWRFVPRINASYEEFEDMADTYEQGEVLFKKFANCFLMLRSPTALDEFRLCYSLLDEDNPDIGSADANLWIGHALQCNARVVRVVNGPEQLQLDPAVFTSKYLKRLRLCNAGLCHGFFGQLQTGCPALEDLFLSDCTIIDNEISSQTLKVLTIDDDSRFSFDRPTSISIPSLISLRLFHPYGRVPLLKNMASLVTASASLNILIADFHVDDMGQFLMGLSGVRSFEFYYTGEQLKMEKNYQWCPKFSNLINLNLGAWCLCADFYALIVFLQNSPSLKKLTLKLTQRRLDTPARIIGELQERSFTCKQLEIVEIICSEGGPLLSSVKQFLRDSGITSGQIRINHLN